MKSIRFIHTLSLLACASGLMLLGASCDNRGPSTPVVLQISLDSNELPGQKATYPLHVSAEGSWVISVEADGASTDWIRVSPNEGKNSQDVIITVQKNNTNTNRSCYLVIKNDKTSSRCKVTQLSSSEIDAPAWLELPAIKSDDNHFFVTHDFEDNGKTFRNYAFLLNKEAKVSEWVAYPLNDDIKGSGSREDAWGSPEAPNLDPKVPREYQAVLYRAYTDNNMYDRGHQIPSADRYRGNSNAMTFYGTNITPQKKNFNQGIWAGFEGKVRNWASKSDTLYVVTGCTVEGSEKFTSDNDGKQITVPTGYYKVLLSYSKNNNKNNSSKKIDGYTSIAFYFDHNKTYSYNANNKEETTTTIFNQSMTVNELEKKLGIDFFASLPDLIGSDKAEKVESLEDNWFRNN